MVVERSVVVVLEAVVESNATAPPQVAPLLEVVLDYQWLNSAQLGGTRQQPDPHPSGP